MRQSIIETCFSKKTPWEVCQSLARRYQTFFFLDSAGYDSSRHRYSFLGARPFLELKESRGRFLLRSNGRTRSFSLKRFIPVFRACLNRYRVSGRRRTPFFTGGAVGYFSYEAARLFESIRFKKRAGVQALFHFGFYRDGIVYDHQKKRYLLVTSVSGRSAAEKKRAVKRLSGLKSFLEPEPLTSERPFRLLRFRAEAKRKPFEKMVEKARSYIAAGDIYQANLSQRFLFRYQGSETAVYERLRTLNPSPFASFLSFGDLKILSSSPECLIEKKGARCVTYPIAGTKPRFRDEAQRRTERKLRQSPKEKAEHIMLVDLERNDLGRVCRPSSVRVKELMRIEKYSHVIHLVSEIEGRIRRGNDALDLVRAVFPGGTITGCPKVHCMEIIDELEASPRGIYTGSLGYLGFDGNMTLNIVIRSLVMKRGQGVLQTGAGIVMDSNPRREYEETLHKAEALRLALEESSTKKVTVTSL